MNCRIVNMEMFPYWELDIENLCVGQKLLYKKDVQGMYFECETSFPWNCSVTNLQWNVL